MIELETKYSEIIFKSIFPETMESISERYMGKLKKEENKVKVEIEAQDIVALRAACNAYLRWIKAVCEICEFAKGGT